MRAARGLTLLAVALGLGAALAAPARAAILDVEEWDEFIRSADEVALFTLAPRDTAALDLADVSWLAGPPGVERRVLNRLHRSLMRKAFQQLALLTPAPCSATEYRWGCVGGETSVPVAEYRRDAEVLRVAFLPREHAAVFAFEGRLLGCVRLDPADHPWMSELGLPWCGERDRGAAPFVDELARVLVQVAPDRGADARAMGVDGAVRIKAMVGMDGRVLWTSVLDGPGMLRGPASKCVQQWRFEPARFDGHPVASWYMTTVRFE